MKNKSALCSTGHGTGVKHRLDLHSLLERRRADKSNKKVARFMKKYPFLFKEKEDEKKQESESVPLAEDGGASPSPSSVAEGGSPA